MQDRQHDRARYFRELATTSRKYFVPYIENFKPIQPGMEILEIGCGDGGDLLPFSKAGCNVTGVDMAVGRIKDAIRFFREAGAEGTFIASDIFKLKEWEHRFDIILCHDVLEHIHDKASFMKGLLRYIKDDGIVFMSFPAWQMPFGGHQQICRNKILSHLPFIHLLPRSIYRFLLTRGGEDAACINELLDIKTTRISIEPFERLCAQTGLCVTDRRLFFINPHYETKFGLKPRRLSPVIGRIPGLRNAFTTSCFYILTGKKR